MKLNTKQQKDKYEQRTCPEKFGNSLFTLDTNGKFIEVFKRSQVNDSLISIFKIEEYASVIVEYDFIIQNEQLRIVYVTQHGDIVVYQSKDNAMFSFYHIWSTRVKGECLCVKANPYEGCDEEFIVTCKGNVYYYKFNSKEGEYSVKEISGFFNRIVIKYLEWEYVYGGDYYFIRVWDEQNKISLCKVKDDFSRGEINKNESDIEKLFLI